MIRAGLLTKTKDIRKVAADEVIVVETGDYD